MPAGCPVARGARPVPGEAGPQIGTRCFLGKAFPVCCPSGWVVMFGPCEEWPQPCRAGLGARAGAEAELWALPGRAACDGERRPASPWGRSLHTAGCPRVCPRGARLPHHGERPAPALPPDQAQPRSRVARALQCRSTCSVALGRAALQLSCALRVDAAGVVSPQLGWVWTARIPS